MHAAGVTFGVVGTLDDIDTDRQMRAIEALVPFAGEDQLTVSSPFQIEGERKRSPRPAPSIGQHSDEVLRDAGYGEAEIARLRGLGVIA